jgi:hypothetical protein
LENPRLSQFSIIIAGDAEYAWKQVQNGRWVIGVLWGLDTKTPSSLDEPMACYFFSRESVEWSAFGDRKALRAMCAVTFRGDISDELFFAAFGDIDGPARRLVTGAVDRSEEVRVVNDALFLAVYRAGNLNAAIRIGDVVVEKREIELVFENISDADGANIVQALSLWLQGMAASLLPGKD